MISGAGKEYSSGLFTPIELCFQLDYTPDEVGSHHGLNFRWSCDFASSINSAEDPLSHACFQYQSMLKEGDEIRKLATHKLGIPVLAVGGGSGDFTFDTLRQVATEVSTITLDNVGHYVAIEAPERLADVLLSFYRKIESPE